MACGPPKQITFETPDRGIRGAAESSGAFSHDLHHRLEVRWRARDDPQDLRGGRLLLESFGQLLVPRFELREQPHVLDGDHGLVGERLEKLDLLIGKWTEGGAP